MKNLLLLASLLLSTQALAQRISIAPFTGPGANAARNQLVSTLCDTADCVPATKTTSGGKPDWKKAKKEGVQFFITGAVAKKGKKSTLTLQAHEKAGAPRLRKQYALERDTLPAKTLATAVEALRGVIGAAAPPPPPPVEPKVTPPPPPPTKTEPTRKDPEPVGVVVKEPPVEERPAPRVRRKTSDHFLVLEAGTDVVNRQFRWVQPVTPNLRNYDLAVFPMPKVGLEFYPMVLLDRDDVLRGLGLEVGAGFMPLLKTRRQSDGAIFPTSTMRIDAGIRWKLRFSRDFPLAVVPIVGVRVHSFSLAASSDGTRLDGVPNLNYVGLRVGVGVEVPLMEDLITIFGQFQVIPVFSSGEIIGADWFPAGSNLGLDGQGGVGVRVLPMLQVRATFLFTQYGLRFTSNTTDQYVAAGASDRYLGGNVSARLQF